MRGIKRKWCLDYFKLSLLLIYLFHFSHALNNADVGLERYDHCAFSYNESLYIIGGNASTTTDSIIMTFNQTNWDTETPIIQRLSNNVTGKVKCGMTKNALLLLLFDDHHVQVLNISSTTNNTTPNNMTYQGSQRAIDAFVTNQSPIKDPAIIGFNDYFLFFGGQQNNHPLQSTFILDTRVNNVGVWYELYDTNNSTSFIGNPPPPSVNTTLVATSRWILHFRMAKINPMTYTVYVDLFDPLNFNWIGTPITAFNTSTDSINAALLSPDTVLITPTWSTFNSSSSNNNSITGFWILNVSTWSPTVTVEWQEINDTYHPMAGNSVTAIQDTDLVVFYGGVHGGMQFFNTTSKSFEHPTWFSQDTNHHRSLLAILLGSILGGLGFFILLFLCIWFCYIRKRRLRKQEFMSRSYDENHAKERMIPNEGTSQFQRSNSMASRYLLSPIKSVLPLFKEHEIENDEQQVKQNEEEVATKIHPTSRFREHFDMTSLPNLKKSNSLDQGQSSSH